MDKNNVKKTVCSPFEEKQIRGDSISYGLSSYGYDARVSNEFKIFTNVNSEIVDPKNFKPTNFVTKNESEHYSTQFLCFSKNCRKI